MKKFFTNKPLIRFFLLFVLFYSAFLATDRVQFIKDAHHSFYTGFGAWVYNTWHPDVRVDISTDVASSGANPDNDYFLTAYDKKETQAIRNHNRQNPRDPKQLKPIAYMSFKARMSHSLATFFLLALIFATPNSLIRKFIGGIIAVYILYILVAMKLTFLMSMADGSKSSDDGIWYFFSGIIGNNESYLELYYILIITIWVLVAISKESIQELTRSRT